jgi:uncharacterized protein YqgC (DUF456 family)
LWILSVVLIAAGLAGTVVPLLPGVPLVFAGLLLAAWSNGFEHVGWAILTILALLTLLSLLVDFAASSIGARRAGATRAAILGAAIGTAIGLFFALPGVLLGPFIGAAVGQLLARRSIGEAMRVGTGAWLGFVVGSVAKLSLAIAMIVVFTLAWFI